MKQNDEASTIFLVAMIIALIAATSIFLGAYSNGMEKCQSVGHSYGFCYELLK